MIDTTKIKVRDTVYFRCGGKAVVKEKNDKRGFVFGDYKYYIHYSGDGSYLSCVCPHPMDIIRVEPAPFDWDTVKQGMAFKDIKGCVWIFECWRSRKNLLCKKTCILTKLEFYNETANNQPRHLYRAPEHDIEVTK